MCGEMPRTSAMARMTRLDLLRDRIVLDPAFRPSPRLRETLSSELPFFSSAALMSAGCQSNATAADP